MDERVDDDLIKTAYARLKEAREHQSEWRKQAREDFDFVAGDQWSEEDKQVLRDQLRPCITFNRVGPVMDTVSGLEISNRQETQYIPREVGDAGVNEALTGAAKYFRDQCDAEDEESEAFQDAATCGLGWTETRLDYDSYQEGQIIIERVDPFEMWYDCAAKKGNLADARYLFRVKQLSESEFRAQFPDAPEDLGKGEDFTFDDAGVLREDPRDAYRESDNPQNKPKFYWVVEYQWCEKTKVAVVEDKGKLIDMPMDRFQKVQEAVPGVKHAKRQQSKYMRAFLCGKTLLSVGPAPCQHGFTYKAITAKRDRNKGTWYGVVRSMKDPQRWANKWLSQSLHILNSNAKGGAFIEETALKNPRKAEETWADPNALIILKDGGSAKIKERPMSQFPAGFDRLMQLAVDAMPQVTGISPELMGLTDHEQAGVVENARKQSGFTIVAKLFNSLRRYRKEQGRLLMYFIQEYIPEGTLIRIGEPHQAKYAPLIKDPNVLQYDVVVDDAPYSPNQKEAVWASLQQLFPVIAKLPIPAAVWSTLLKYSPLPQSASAEIEAQLQQPMPDPEEQKQQHEMAMKEREAQEKSKEREANMAIKGVDFQMKQIDLAMKQVEAGMKGRELDASAKQAEAEANQKRFENDSKAVETSAVDQFAQAAAMLAQAAQMMAMSMQQPKRKRVNVLRGADGMVVGADVDEVQETIQ